MSKFYVYEHWRLDRDECFYVGKGCGNRAYIFKQRNRHHSGIVAKVRREGFAIEVRIVASGLEEQEAYALEVERITFWKNAGVDLANQTTGGLGFSGVMTNEHKGKIAEAARNRKWTDKQRAILAAKAKAEWEVKRIAGAAFIPDETKAKMSAVKLGKKKSEETKARMSVARKGEKRGPQSPEHIAARVEGGRAKAEERGFWNIRDTVKD